MATTKTNSNRFLDRIDRAILDTLQRDGRISNVELAKRVNLSPSPCLERVRRLDAEGFIEGYFAKLNASKLNLGTTAFVEVTLDRTTSEVFNQFRDGIGRIAEVAECHMVVGNFDYLLRLRIADMEDYRKVLNRLVDIPGVAQTHTYISVEQIQQNQGIPIEV